MGTTAVMDPRDEEQVAHYQHKGYFDVVFEAPRRLPWASSVDFTHPAGTIVQVGWAPAR